MFVFAWLEMKIPTWLRSGTRLFSTTLEREMDEAWSLPVKYERNPGWQRR